ncbi:hypothetical protein OHB31_31490 [Streptomyces microflavus]|uniref:hypothetical protein n=1 Tax=Streptomyces microflavus TaxID=1919 RepID=UPI002DD8DAC9|nr:hypothetical protein [Streptomyces microflavus]WSA64409.1 hypothetical protein OHB31_31490 [Streptomyces microflavus]
MPSVIGLPEERERAAAQRVELLREKADRALAQLRDAERDWERFVVSRETVVEVLAGPGHDDAAAGAGGPVTENSEPAPAPTPTPFPVPRSVVPVWCEGRGVPVLSADYQRLMAVLPGQGGSLSCKEIVSALGVAPVHSKTEGVRSKTNRLVARGWLVKEPSGRFALAPGLRGAGS